MAFLHTSQLLTQLRLTKLWNLHKFDNTHCKKAPTGILHQVMILGNQMPSFETTITL